jgi:hypothetical protein
MSIVVNDFSTEKTLDNAKTQGMYLEDQMKARVKMKPGDMVGKHLVIMKTEIEAMTLVGQTLWRFYRHTTDTWFPHYPEVMDHLKRMDAWEANNLNAVCRRCRS